MVHTATCVCAQNTIEDISCAHEVTAEQPGHMLKKKSGRLLMAIQ